SDQIFLVAFLLPSAVPTELYTLSLHDALPILPLVRRDLVRSRADRPDLRPRDGALARGEAPGTARVGAALHPVPRREHLPQGAAAERLARVRAGDRGAAARIDRSACRVRSGSRGGLEPPAGDRFPRVLHQPLPPAPG